jgi:hypothetical protein
MSLIIATKIPSAIVVASDRRVTGSDKNEKYEYQFISTDAEQKTFIVANSFAISYCGNANINGIPASAHLIKIANNAKSATSTFDIAEVAKKYWIENHIENKPSLIISGYNSDGASIIEVKPTNDEIVVHQKPGDTYGLVYNGETSVAEAIINLESFQWSLMRIQDAIDLCDLMITTTARTLLLQKKQQTVSKEYDLLIITNQGAKWVISPAFPLV